MKNLKDMQIVAGIDVHKKHWNVSIYVGKTHHRDLHSGMEIGGLGSLLNGSSQWMTCQPVIMLF